MQIVCNVIPSSFQSLGVANNVKLDTLEPAVKSQLHLPKWSQVTSSTTSLCFQKPRPKGSTEKVSFLFPVGK